MCIKTRPFNLDTYNFSWLRPCLVLVVIYTACARRVQNRQDFHSHKISGSGLAPEDKVFASDQAEWAVASHFQPDYAVLLKKLLKSKNQSCVGRSVPPPELIRNMAFLCFQLGFNVVNAEFQLAVKGSYEWKGALSDADYKGVAATITGAAILYLAPVSLHLIIQGEMKITSNQARSHKDMLKLSLGSLVKSRLLGSGPTLDDQVHAMVDRLAKADSSYNAQQAKEGKLDQRFTFSMKKRVMILQQSLALQLEARSALFLKGFQRSENQQEKILKMLRVGDEHRLQEWWIDKNPREMEEDFSAAQQIFNMSMGGPILLPSPEKLAPRGGVLLRRIGETLIRMRKGELLMLSREVALLVARTLFKPSGELGLDDFNCDSLAESATVPLKSCPPNKPNCYKDLLSQDNFADSRDLRFKVMHSDSSAVSRARLTCFLAEGLHGLPQRGIQPQDIDKLRHFWSSNGNSIPNAILMVLPDFFFSVRQFIEFTDGLHWAGDYEISTGRPHLQELMSSLQLQKQSIDTFISEILGADSANFVTQNMGSLIQSVGHIRSAAIIKNYLQKSLDAINVQETTDSQPFRFDWTFTGQLTFQANFLNTSRANWSACTGAPVGWDWSQFQSGWMPSTSESIVVRCDHASVCKAEPEKKTSTTALYLMLALTWPGIDQKIGYKLFQIDNSHSSSSGVVAERERVVIHAFQILLGQISLEDSAFQSQLLTIGQALLAPLLEAIRSFGNPLGDDAMPDNMEQASLMKRITDSFHPAAIIAAAFAASSSLVSIGGAGSFVGLDLTIRYTGKASAGTLRRSITAVLWLANVISIGSSELGKLSAIATGIGWGGHASLANAMELDLSGLVLKGACES